MRLKLHGRMRACHGPIELANRWACRQGEKAQGVGPRLAALRPVAMVSVAHELGAARAAGSHPLTQLGAKVLHLCLHASSWRSAVTIAPPPAGWARGKVPHHHAR